MGRLVAVASCFIALMPAKSIVAQTKVASRPSAVVRPAEAEGVSQRHALGSDVTSNDSQRMVHVSSLDALKSLKVGSAEALIAERCGRESEGDMPCVHYRLVRGLPNLGDGAGDDGAEIRSTTPGYFWRLAAQTFYDPRIWGAKGDVRLFKAKDSVRLDAARSTIAIPSNPCTAAYGDGTAKIVVSSVTSATGATPSKASYHGTITGCLGSAFVVTPAPSSSAVSPQDAFYGHVDTKALNRWAAYVGTIASNKAAFAPMSAGGLNYGVDGPVIFGGGGIRVYDLNVTVLDPTNFRPSNAAVVSDATNQDFDHVAIDLAYLPVNGFMANKNGATRLHSPDIRHWFGAFANSTVTVKASCRVGSFHLAVATTERLAHHLVANGAAEVGLPDRAVILGIGPADIVVNKPCTASFEDQAVTFESQPSGVIAASRHAAYHIDGTGQIREHDRRPGQINNADNYGFAIYNNGSQGFVIHTVAMGGACTVAIGPESKGFNIYLSQMFNVDMNKTEVNPSILCAADGATSTYVLGGSGNGVVQAAFLYGEEAPILSIGGGFKFVRNRHGVASPNNSIQYFTGRVETSPAGIYLDQNILAPVGRGVIALTGYGSAGGPPGIYGKDYSWSGYSAEQAITQAAVEGGVMITPRGGRLAVKGIDLLAGDVFATNLLCSGGAPFVLSGFGTSARIQNANGSCSFEIKVGVDGAATSGIVQFARAASSGWSCSVNNLTTHNATVFVTHQVAETTKSATFQNFSSSGDTGPWNGGDVLAVSCQGH